MSISSNAFGGCTALTTASFDNCVYIDNRAFGWCYSLNRVTLPNCRYISDTAFAYCSALSTISLPNCASIGGYAFFSCVHLLSFYLTGSSMVTIEYPDVFSHTPIADSTASTGGVYGSIFVPASLYASYIANAVWSYYSQRFVSLTDEQILALE